MVSIEKNIHLQKFQYFITPNLPMAVTVKVFKTIFIFAIAVSIAQLILTNIKCLKTSWTNNREHHPVLEVSISQHEAIHEKLAEIEPVLYVCEYETTTFYPNCLCYAEHNETTHVVTTRHNKKFIDINAIQCALTVNGIGRLGNLMGEYATLTGLADINKRPAFMKKDMANVLKKYFKVTMPTISEELYSQIPWTYVEVQDWMDESDKNYKDQFIYLNGFPNSFTFYHHLRDKIKKEFTLHDHIKEKAQSVLKSLSKNKTTTFVGVHVRRGDYVQLMNERYKGVLAGKDFFVQATDYFRQKYSDVVFVVVSDEMDWCKQNIQNERDDVNFVGNNDESNPIDDFAILVNCNHTIFTIGTYGYWAAYLVGGETVCLTNYTLPASPFLQVMKYKATLLPQWIKIAADLSPLYKSNASQNESTD